ncbi:MAG: hypothetical protein JW809_05755 [Pirellulales bacterium]|nr:hypothetical protein [Pirellulales bacterium]
MSGKERRSFSAERKVEALQKKLADKNEVIAELMEANLQAKKAHPAREYAGLRPGIFKA